LINNPKVAGSKIHIDLVNILLDADFKNEQRGHYQIDWYDDVSDVSVDQTVKLLFSDDVFKFAFVRNPYDRLLSAWSYFCIDLESDDINYNHVREIMKQRGTEFQGRITFQSFVDLIYSHWEQMGCFDNEHWFEQNKTIMYDLVNIDFIGKLENFQKDYTYVLSKLGAPDRFYRGLDEKENRSTRNDNLSEIYTGNLKDKLYEMYKKDFQIFGYNKNLQNL
jgi:hypothetical protein